MSVVVAVASRRPTIMAIAALYPIVTIVVIFSTANHYLLDAAVGVAVATFALYGGFLLQRRREGPGRRRITK
ncbi:MAG: hypothetical protein JWR24_2144 [Actinoallomurus sp.]|nr:hypothetical protein [Actinoallomurus sp.]